MRIKVNGNESEISDGQTVANLLSQKGISPETVVIEYNGEILKREFFGEKQIKNGDQIEILSFVGGG